MGTSAFLPFKGILDDIQIYSQALSASSVSSLYSPLAAYWKLDEPSGATSFADASGNGNTGTCGGACPTMGAAGKVGTAASFNGTNSQIIIPDSPSLALNQFTIALWVFPTQVKSDYQLLVAKEDSTQQPTATTACILCRIRCRSAIRFGLAIAPQNWGPTASASSSLNTWNHVVFTYDGNTAELYLNGVLDSATAAPAATLCHGCCAGKDRHGNIRVSALQREVSMTSRSTARHSPPHKCVESV